MLQSTECFLLLLLFTCGGESAKKSKINKNKYVSIENEVLDKVQLNNKPFFIIQTNLTNYDLERREITYEEVVTPIEGVCSAGVLHDIMLTKNRVACKARETLVDLVTREDLHIEPKAVFVRRCRGVCNKQLNCKPSEIIMKTIHLKQFKDGKLICISVTVPEHKNCTCKCAKTEKDCNKNQRYDPNTCSCHCKNMNVQKRCYTNNYTYDYKTCSCKCPKKHCTTGTTWDENKCRCVLLRNRRNNKPTLFVLQ